MLSEVASCVNLLAFLLEYKLLEGKDPACPALDTKGGKDSMYFCWMPGTPRLKVSCPQNGSPGGAQGPPRDLVLPTLGLITDHPNRLATC